MWLRIPALKTKLKQSEPSNLFETGPDDLKDIGGRILVAMSRSTNEIYSKLSDREFEGLSSRSKEFLLESFEKVSKAMGVGEF